MQAGRTNQDQCDDRSIQARHAALPDRSRVLRWRTQGMGHALVRAFVGGARDPHALDAPDDVLDARIAARGEPIGPALAERGVWRATMASHPYGAPVRTDRPAAVVQAELLAWALRALESP